MNATVTIDKAGRMVLPKEVRDQLRLKPGDHLDLTSDGAQVTLRPARAARRMRKVDGMWSFSCGVPVTAEETDRVLAEIRAGKRDL